jgi:HTH-type transcriptional regulator / antitoxin HigA
MQPQLTIKSLIKTEADYENALGRVDDLLNSDAKKGTSDGDELELLIVLIEAYEKQHYPIPPPHPIEAIKFQLDQMGISELELDKMLGSRSRKTDILSGKRKLNLAMIRVLHEKLKIPAESLIAAY